MSFFRNIEAFKYFRYYNSLAENTGVHRGGKSQAISVLQKYRDKLCKNLEQLLA